MRPRRRELVVVVVDVVGMVVVGRALLTTLAHHSCCSIAAVGSHSKGSGGSGSLGSTSPAGGGTAFLTFSASPRLVSLSTTTPKAAVDVTGLYRASRSSSRNRTNEAICRVTRIGLASTSSSLGGGADVVLIMAAGGVLLLLLAAAGLPPREEVMDNTAVLTRVLASGFFSSTGSGGPV
jgi:hypothetical protein